MTTSSPSDWPARRLAWSSVDRRWMRGPVKSRRADRKQSSEVVPGHPRIIEELLECDLRGWTQTQLTAAGVALIVEAFPRGQRCGDDVNLELG